MSSVSFPQSGHGSLTSSSSSHHDQFYAQSFDSNSSFQMNPLSSHPPRTPRTSIISSGSQIYGNSIYENKGEDQETHQELEKELDDQEEEKVKSLQVRVRKEDVWREMFLTSNGRDKAFKLIQYSIKVYLLLHTNMTATQLLRRPSRPPWELGMINRLTSTASGLSFTRKCLLLFNWLAPLTTIMAQHSVPYSSEGSSESLKKASKKPLLYTILYAPPPVLLELVQAVADDVYTFSRLGLLGKKTGEKAGRFSDWCWLLATLVALVENGVERGIIGHQRSEVESRAYLESMTGSTAKSKPTASKIDEKELGRLRRKEYWLKVTRAKLVMDLIFVSYDVFQIQRAREPMKAFTGLASAVLSSSKLYDRHKTELVKALTFGT